MSREVHVRFCESPRVRFPRATYPKLLGPQKWTYYHLYVVLDVYSRYVVGWRLEARESATLATELFTETIAKEHVAHLIADGTYFIVDIDGVIAACGGWSMRRKIYGGDVFVSGRDDGLLDPAKDAAKIRAFYVHPEYARRGLGSLLLQHSERAARAAGFTRFEMGATLTGVRLYERRGYVPVGRADISLCNGEYLAIVRMMKAEA